MNSSFSSLPPFGKRSPSSPLAERARRFGVGLERRTDSPRLAHRFEQLERRLPQLQQMVPSLRQFRVSKTVPGAGVQQVHALGAMTRKMRIDFIGSKRNQRREHPRQDVQIIR